MHLLVIASSQGFSFADSFAVWQLVGGLGLLVAVAALRRAGDRAFSPAIVYLLLGVALALVLPATGVDRLDPEGDAELIEHLAEFAVVVALFGAGVRLDRPLGLPGWRSTVLLLGVVMPLTIGAVALWGAMAMGLSAGAAVLLGAILAPTDPVLASEVQVGPPGEDEEPEPPFALTSEAGLNDGLAFPFVFLALYLLGDESGWVLDWVLADVVLKITVGVVVGALLGHLAGLLVLRVAGAAAIHEGLAAWVAIGLVLIIYGAVEAAGGYGFLGVFAGGLAFRRFEAGHEGNEGMHAGIQGIENATELALVLLLGSLVTLDGLGAPGLAGWLLVPVLLFVVRPAAVLLAFARSEVPVSERLFIGWFGIRGIGSIYYLATALVAGVLAAGEARAVVWTVLVTIAASIVLHGVSAAPLSRRLFPPTPAGDGP